MLFYASCERQNKKKIKPEKNRQKQTKLRQIAFSELLRISHGNIYLQSFFSISAFILCAGSQYVSSDM